MTEKKKEKKKKEIAHEAAPPSISSSSLKLPLQLRGKSERDDDGVKEIREAAIGAPWVCSVRAEKLRQGQNNVQTLLSEARICENVCLPTRSETRREPGCFFRRHTRFKDRGGNGKMSKTDRAECKADAPQ